MLRVVNNDKKRISSLMKEIGVDEAGIKIMLPKSQGFLLKTGELSTTAANILKQDLISLGADAAVARWSITGDKTPTQCLILANETRLRQLAKKIATQPFGLEKLAQGIEDTINNYRKDNFLFQARNYKLQLGKTTRLMGIINATPDSFSGDGLFSGNVQLEKAEIEELFLKLKSQGAEIIDIGGESTRPGAKSVSAKEEIKRILPFIKIGARIVKLPISIDTQKFEVAQAALDNGAAIVNDISGLRHDKRMARLIAKYRAAVVIMHMRGNPRTMQKNIQYSSLMDEIISFLNDSVKIALDAGINPQSIAVDPGICFGKTREHNLEIINNLCELKSLGLPILIGLSRKSFIGTTINKPSEQRIFGTAAALALAISQGAHIVRIHDVAEMKDVVKMADAVRTAR